MVCNRQRVLNFKKKLNAYISLATITHLSNAEKMASDYQEFSFNKGHRVLLVSHSQGNLWANDMVKSFKPWQRKFFRNVAVAVPADHLEAEGRHTTLSCDKVMMVIPGHLKWNVKCYGVEDLSGHEFLRSYLRNSQSESKVFRDINFYLLILGALPSQWIVDQEYDKSTCDYRITIKHFFDKSEEFGGEIYPFALDGKLYSINGQYVKASCGGKNILSAWEGKKKNECWMIDNPQKETIVKANDSVAKLYVRYDYRDYIEGCSGEGFTGSIGFTNSEFKFLNRSCDGYGSGGRCTSDAEGRMEYILNLTPKENKNFIAHNLFRTLECILTQHNKTYDDVVAIRKGGIRREVYNGGGKIYVEYLIDFK